MDIQLPQIVCVGLRTCGTVADTMVIWVAGFVFQLSLPTAGIQ